MAAWTPIELGASLIGWFDGMDAATITIAGSGVSAWGNKGVSSLTLSQGVDARRPSYASNMVKFTHTGAGQHLIGGIIAPNPVAAYDFLIAGKPNQGGIDWRTLIYSTGQHVTIEDTSERYGVYNQGMFATGIWGNVAGLSYGQISNAGPAKLSRDGGALVSSNTTLGGDTSVWGFGSAGSYGGGGVVDQAWGDVYEFIIVPYNSSDDIRQKLEGYAAWKWSLASLLPVDHPYKNAAPTTGAPPAKLMKVWSGSAWVVKPVKVWTGSVWQAKPVKVWDGSTWI